MTFDKIKFISKYPEKLKRDGHNIPVSVIEDIIKNPFRQSISDNKDRLEFYNDPKNNLVEVVVSATTSGVNTIARVYSAHIGKEKSFWRKFQEEV